MNVYSTQLCFHPLNHNHDTKEAFMCHSVPVSLCALFISLQRSIRHSNATKQTDSQMQHAARPCSFLSTIFLTPNSIKNFPIPISIQIHAWNIAKAAIIMTKIGKEFRVMKLGCGWYAMDPIHDNFLSCWQLHMLIIGQHDKMLRDLRKQLRKDRAICYINGDSGQW